MSMAEDQTPLACDYADALAQLQFITARWHELGEPCELVLRSYGESLTPMHNRFEHSAEGLQDAAEWAASLSAHNGRNVYPVVNPLRPGVGAGSDEDVIASFFHWADADTETATEKLKSWAGPKWRCVVITGTTPSRRVHVYWELREPQRDMKAWRRTQQAIAAEFSSDASVINPSRIMKLAGTISWPDTKKQRRGYIAEQATLRLFEDRPLVESETFARLFRAAQQQDSGFQFDTEDRAAPLDRDRAKVAASSGEEWHNNVIRLVASYVSKGLSDAEIHSLTDPLTLPGYTVEQTRSEVQTAINGARAKGWTPEPHADPAAVWDAQSEDGDEPQDVEWFDDIQPALTDGYIVKNLIQLGAMSVVYGASNTGKTFFALDLAFHIAIQSPWRGRRINGGGVLYLAAEGGRGALNRLAALKQETGCCDVPLALKRAGLDLLRNTADIKSVVTLARAVNDRAPLKLIVIDTLSRVMAGGDENAPQDMTALIRNIDAIREATGAHVMLIHHSGKDEARGARGHSSLRAAVDTEIEVINDDSGRGAFVRKQRDYEGGEIFAFTLKPVTLGVDQDGDDVVSCIVENGDSDEFMAARKASKGLGGNQKIIAETFDQMLAEGMGTPNPGGVGMPESGQFWTVPMDELRRIARGKMPGKDTRGAFNQAFSALAGERGLFGAGEMMVWRTDRKCR